MIYRKNDPAKKQRNEKKILVKLTDNYRRIKKRVF